MFASLMTQKEKVCSTKPLIKNLIPYMRELETETTKVCVYFSGISVYRYTLDIGPGLVCEIPKSECSPTGRTLDLRKDFTLCPKSVDFEAGEFCFMMSNVKIYVCHSSYSNKMDAYVTKMTQFHLDELHATNKKKNPLNRKNLPDHVVFQTSKGHISPHSQKTKQVDTEQQQC